MAEKGKFQRRKVVLLAAGALAILAVLNYTGFQTIVEVRQAWEAQTRLEREVRQLREQNEALTREVEDLEDDGPGVERIAREKLGMARPGEVIVKIPEKR